ncbi:hypothetical protein [Fischerella thermalis]|jgi:methyl-accepting chemotaxis protein PixJ|nr:hypothetical protein [Fischerella thermalis]PLZ23182.1 hypothetical protein CBP30_04045 [Fischerella thermalis WC157]PLZ37670.1 hypothetical protein CBP26_18210 [Fischerella thermalis WC538]PLZ59033.1 hypothetical protein CBP23_21410 [Fischerella thermalis WC344]PLZ66774.1 hypothetical protein CBP21_18015 [Fischerella thermalis WC246]PLZ79259.1 hypothetical protein CBP16_17225 [Fischerella thermalis WC217]PLZ95496.1 hypothetical protein CI592_22110 [Fischerella thermalis CCMEE 5328]PMB103
MEKTSGERDVNSPIARFMRQLMKNNTQDNQEITEHSESLALDVNSLDAYQIDDVNQNATMQNLEQSESRFNPVIFGNSSFMKWEQ